MGSFNSAPKINNIDTQDDGIEFPKDLNTNELLQHVKSLRGENHPPLLTRYFLKPSYTASMVSNDITDGLRFLKFNSVSRGKIFQNIHKKYQNKNIFVFSLQCTTLWTK